MRDGGRSGKQISGSYFKWFFKGEDSRCPFQNEMQATNPVSKIPLHQKKGLNVFPHFEKNEGKSGFPYVGVVKKKWSVEGPNKKGILSIPCRQ